MITFTFWMLHPIGNIDYHTPYRQVTSSREDHDYGFARGPSHLVDVGWKREWVERLARNLAEIDIGWGRVGTDGKVIHEVKIVEIINDEENGLDYLEVDLGNVTSCPPDKWTWDHGSHTFKVRDDWVEPVG